MNVVKGRWIVESHWGLFIQVHTLLPGTILNTECTVFINHSFVQSFIYSDRSVRHRARPQGCKLIV